MPKHFYLYSEFELKYLVVLLCRILGNVFGTRSQPKDSIPVPSIFRVNKYILIKDIVSQLNLWFESCLLSRCLVPHDHFTTDYICQAKTNCL